MTFNDAIGGATEIATLNLTTGAATFGGAVRATTITGTTTGTTTFNGATTVGAGNATFAGDVRALGPLISER